MIRGSSPLARGLLISLISFTSVSRIIPARAGFTTGRRGTRRPGADHPRSRGVYDEKNKANGSYYGSSPLARGLPGTCRILRIIRLDHPRSRGVYGVPRCRVWGGVGIIPARAGFTPPQRPAPGRTSDHPRSRGVYDWDNGLSSSVCGSSPLARGLHNLPAESVGGEGIIPARAGFTLGVRGVSEQEADHPRSRGVYQRHDHILESGLGSSPLARGLHTRVEPVALVPRIIPARAGFTTRSRSPRWGTRDHPRSRGVYSDRGVGTPWCSGSSPLARGLLVGQKVYGVYERIIPARAGFTPR